MGKPTGFLEYERKDSVGETPLKRIRHFNEFHTPLSKKRTGKTRSQMHELRRAVLSVRHPD